MICISVSYISFYVLDDLQVHLHCDTSACACVRVHAHVRVT